MIIRQHHFFDSYLSATGAKDKSLTEKILLNEIANIIVVRPDVAISNLEKAGVEIKPAATPNEIASAYIYNLNNKELAKSLAYDIANFNRVSFDGKEYGQEFFNSDKDGRATGSSGSASGYKSMDYGELAGSLVNLGTSIAGAVQTGKENKRAKKDQRASESAAKAEAMLQKQVAAKTAMIENTVAKLKAQKAAEKKKGVNKNIYLVLGVGGGLLVLGALATYAINRASQAAGATGAGQVPAPLKV